MEKLRNLTPSSLLILLVLAALALTLIGYYCPWGRFFADVHSELWGTIVAVYFIDRVLKYHEEQKRLPLLENKQNRLKSFSNTWTNMFQAHTGTKLSEIQPNSSMVDYLHPSIYRSFALSMNVFKERCTDLIILYSDCLTSIEKTQLLTIKEHAEIVYSIFDFASGRGKYHDEETMKKKLGSRKETVNESLEAIKSALSHIAENV